MARDSYRDQARELQEHHPEVVAARPRAQAYQLLGEHFAVPPPPAVGSGGRVDRWVRCDHRAVDVAMRELNQIADQAQADLDDAGRARLRLNDSTTGEAAQAAQDNLRLIEQTSRRLIVAIEATRHALGVVNRDVASVDQQFARHLAFP